ncbi:LTA synthase family protein [Oenococcus kitaharae]|uniref:Lipoteichoic acid synthase Type IIb n=1 Tax=Oenococcus kitaharae DSM 17330 TaxID=1045004 RepID=G9WJ10_9LACO|nr:LTA synthase family protein [Oenococcus kitaharae]EHN58459.1 Lipoteichoic acid synthase Type IIb [Oenococcus kitaharae DSM 17330]MCV3296302.1 LTA synthase family protein [Oenococcus kitaharae]OEY81386.1 alkaline phosphatase [Oenococcus kitaharae]OEY82874.1 alkaline phosphatase [Oenococcus kitaharae]OEY84582.1 alkaline phosphatase [Oenococcus kitaharae]
MTSALKIFAGHIINRFNPNRSRAAFLWLLTLFFWAKTLLAYFSDFAGLGAADPFQFFIMIINPLATMIIIFSLVSFIKHKLPFYITALSVDALLTLLLYINCIYYREMTSFVSVNVMLGYSKVNQGLGSASLSLMHFQDPFYWLDLIVIIVLLLLRRVRMQEKSVSKQHSFLALSLGFLALCFNLFLADCSRPQLLTRGFDDTYFVKYMGINFYTVQDAINTVQINTLRNSAKPSDLNPIKQFIRSHYAKPNKKYFGIAKGRNVIYIHLESFQQFAIDLKINGQEVTPFLNSLYHGKDTIAFSNFFHQVGQGKTSDAENMLETSTFGLPTGSLFNKYATNTFQAMPAIINQRRGYSTAVFHGNVASFWNRNVVYKSLGYQHFLDASYFDVSGYKSEGWGLKDKLLFKDSVPYLEKMQQPFYVKYLTVTNHYPFQLDKIDQDPKFQTTATGDPIIDNYFLTNHYLDQSIKEFYAYLDKAGLLKKSIIVLYGDHYGISNSENKTLATVFGRDPATWTANDDAQLQRVPYMIDIPGSKVGHIDPTYGGEIDALPTLEHLLGISNKRYLQFGQDLLSKQHQQLVAFRDQDFVTPKYTYTGGKLWDNASGQPIDEKTMLPKLANQVKKWQDQVSDELSLSDQLTYKDLMRFYHPQGFTDVDPKRYDYGIRNTRQQLNRQNRILGKKSTSLWSKNNDKTTASLYKTDAPEQYFKPSNWARIQYHNPDDSAGRTK